MNNHFPFCEGQTNDQNKVRVVHQPVVGVDSAARMICHAITDSQIKNVLNHKNRPVKNDRHQPRWAPTIVINQATAFGAGFPETSAPRLRKHRGGRSEEMEVSAFL